MRILIFHSYLLRGTGSNIYNASLCAALVRLGHEVHLLCQERSAAELDFVDRVARPGDPVEPARCTVWLPEIGRVLPVYVADTYEGFDAVPYPDLDDASVERYLDANVAAVREVAEAVGPDVALANHLIMGPVILARAGLGYALAIHGSDLSYTILPDLERFGPYAREACDGAAGILVGSGHIAERLRQAVDDPQTDAKVRLGPPGVDTALFAPMPGSRCNSAIN